MSKAIFVTTEDIKRHSIIDGNVDPDKIVQFVEIAQDIHTQSYLGTDLYNKLQALILADELDLVINVNYKNLLNTYVVPMQVHWAVVEYLPYAPFTISNGGVSKHLSESSTSIEQFETNAIISKTRSTAQFYTTRLVQHMCNYNNLYPEYTSNSLDDMNPESKGYYTGWVL